MNVARRLGQLAGAVTGLFGVPGLVIVLAILFGIAGVLLR